MKIATYNVRVDTEYDQDWQWSFRKEAVCQLINFHDWSLCCIQEVRPNQVRDKVLPACPTTSVALSYL